MTIDQTLAGWKCSQYLLGRLFQQHYRGYTREQARKLFIKYLETVDWVE